MSNWRQAFNKVYSNRKYVVLTVVLTLMILVLYYWLLTRSVSWNSLWRMNAGWYNAAQISLSVVNSLLIAISLTMFVYIVRTMRAKETSFLQSLASLFFSAATSGCYVCGTVLLPSLGLTASLTALPFGGLEVKVLVIGLLVFTINDYAKKINGLCSINTRPFIDRQNGKLQLNFHKQTWKPILVTMVFAGVIMLLPILPDFWGDSFQESVATADVKGSYSCHE